MLVDDRDGGVQPDLLEAHVDVGRRLANLDRLRVPVVAVDRDVQPVRAGCEPVDVQRRGAEELAIEEDRRTGHVAADTQDTGRPGRDGGRWAVDSPGSRTGTVDRPRPASRAIGPAPGQEQGVAAPAPGARPFPQAAAAARTRTRRRRRQTAAPSTITSSIGPRRDVGGGSRRTPSCGPSVRFAPARGRLEA